MLSTFRIWIKTLLISLLLFTIHPNKAKAQFSYAGFHLGYTWINIDGGGGFWTGNTESSRINQLTATLNFMHRPVRRVGIGMNMNIPVVRGFKSDYTDPDFFIGPGYDSYNYEHKIQNSFGVTLVGRLYFSDESSFYIDLRYTLSSVNETFEIDGSSSASRYLNYDENYSARGPGFELGGLAQFHDHFYLNYGFVMDFITYDVGNSNYATETNKNNTATNKVRFQSMVAESGFSYMIHYGIGYRF